MHGGTYKLEYTRVGRINRRDTHMEGYTFKRTYTRGYTQARGTYTEGHRQEYTQAGETHERGEYTEGYIYGRTYLRGGGTNTDKHINGSTHKWRGGGRRKYTYKILLHKGLKFLLALTYSQQRSYTKNHARFQRQIPGSKKRYR